MAIIGFISKAASATLFVIITSRFDAVEATNFHRIQKTIYERQSDDGPRHSPLFELPVGEEGADFPKKMVLFNNDLYGSKEGLLAEDPHDLIGYNQGHCVETVATDGFVAECFFTFVFGDEGSFTANGPFNFDAAEGVLPTVLAVTGGTGDYKKYQGEAAISAGPSVDFPSLQFDVKIFKPK